MIWHGVVVVLFGCQALGASAAEALAPDRRIPGLIQSLDGNAWRQAQEALVQIGGPAVDPLLEALNGNRG